tara:strand:- start:11451 stop:11984 length:534 start_codon:yes stop_codon:yes gene_type:complete
MATTKWKIDSSHSEIGFKVKHMMFTNVSGKFQEFEAQAETEEEIFENVMFKFNAPTESLTTGNSERDEHLKSGDFFDVENFPKVTFESNSYKKLNNGNYELSGELTLHGVTKPIILNSEFYGTVVDPWGNKKVGFGITGKINRKQWGLNWNSTLEAGGLLVGEDISLIIELQFIKQE